MRTFDLLSFRSLLVSSILFVGLTNYTLGQQNRSTIGGFVFNPERQPVAEIYVELLDEVNGVIARVRTDGSGRYLFRGLSSGRFTLRVPSLGGNFEVLSEDVEIAGVGVGGRQLSDNVQRDLYLRYRKSQTELNELTGVLYAQSVPTAAQEAYKKAVDDLRGNKTDLGIQGLRQAIAIFPTYLLALEKLGMTLLTLNDYTGAKEIFSRAVAVYDRSFTSWYGLGYANYALKSYDDALTTLEKAVRLNNSSMRALFLLGLTYRQLKRYSDAESALLKAVKAADGDAADVHWNLALLYAHDMGRYKDAADHLETYMKQSPDLPNKEAIKKLIKQFREKARTS